MNCAWNQASKTSAATEAAMVQRGACSAFGQLHLSLAEVLEWSSLVAPHRARPIHEITKRWCLVLLKGRRVLRFVLQEEQWPQQQKISENLMQGCRLKHYGGRNDILQVSESCVELSRLLKLQYPAVAKDLGLGLYRGWGKPHRSSTVKGAGRTHILGHATYLVLLLISRALKSITFNARPFARIGPLYGRNSCHILLLLLDNLEENISFLRGEEVTLSPNTVFPCAPLYRILTILLLVLIIVIETCIYCTEIQLERSIQVSRNNVAGLCLIFFLNCGLWVKDIGFLKA